MYYTFTTPCGKQLQTFNDEEEYAVDDLYQQYLSHATQYSHSDECYRSEGDEKYFIRQQMVVTQS